MPQNNNDFKHNLKYDFKSNFDHDLGDLLDNAVQFGTGVGATVLGSLSDALAQAGDAISAARGVPPDSFAAWKRRLDFKLKNGGYSAGIALTVVGWTFTGIFGITALVMGILWGVGPAALGVSDAAFRVFPILFFCSYPAMLGFLYMAVAGMRKLFYFSRLRKLLRAARDWQCDLPGLARTALLKQEQVYKDVQKAVADGDFPGAAYSADFSTLYFDDTLYHPVEAPAPAESSAPAEPLSEPEQFRRECEAFFAYLQSCRGCLGRDTDAELDAMQKTCRALLDFTAKALRIYCGVLGLFGIQMACQMTFVAIGYAGSSVVVAVMRKIVLLLPLIYLMPRLLADQTMAVYAAEPVADVLAVTFTAILFAIQFRRALGKMKS